MDFGIGFLSNNVMLPILDFFYGKFPSYGLAIVALTLVIRIALFPVNANQLRNMRNMKIANPIMQKRIKEVQERYKGDPAKQQQEMAKVNSENFKEFGNPLAGCLPALLQMPILFALFATLRGSPFSDINYAVNFQVSPTQVQSEAFTTPPQNIYFADRVHYPVQATVSTGTNLAVGSETKVLLQAVEASKVEDFTKVSTRFPDIDLAPKWQITKGEGVVEVLPDGTVKALKEGEATVQATIPGLAANKGFLFIKALGEVGVSNPDGSLKLDILAMILAFGISLYINQNISGSKPANPSENQQQDTMNKITPVIFSGMFLFFPLPAGVLLYMLVANVFQTAQAFIVSKEPLPENLQKLAEAGVGASPEAIAPSTSKAAKLPLKAESKKNEPKDEVSLPFEPGSPKKKKG
ncbi:membrane protein insertase, YidC/Oxa1 family, C-terminal domain protein [Synechococcus sp. PCC 7502]|uniref:membrane protein insertase YidC n=1 Tax=Synechococcus sp. PCC 7502 TaxID=1173263 RepID=UPI00029FE1A8|nr:membrane protein insertase YidC [Synechococcus sp. PCC 7502]AFY74382.1 membrane protein insertase, YidC/Oxa1 family, C-terminal domain protein [Synechococcus sp. PCC 7502]